MIPNATMMKDVLIEAATSAKGDGLMVSASGERDLFGEALHMIGVSDWDLRDHTDGSVKVLTAIGAVSAYLESGVMWDRGKKGDALQWARVWSTGRTVGMVREQLRKAGVSIEERSQGDELCNQ